MLAGAGKWALKKLRASHRQTVTYPVVGFPGVLGGPNLGSCPNRRPPDLNPRFDIQPVWISALPEVTR